VLISVRWTLKHSFTNHCVDRRCRRLTRLRRDGRWMQWLVRSVPSKTAGRPSGGWPMPLRTPATATSTTACRSERCSRPTWPWDERAWSARPAECVVAEEATRRRQSSAATPTTTATSATIAPTAQRRGTINQSYCRVDSQLHQCWCGLNGAIDFVVACLVLMIWLIGANCNRYSSSITLALHDSWWLMKQVYWVCRAFSQRTESVPEFYSSRVALTVDSADSYKYVFSILCAFPVVYWCPVFLC